MARLPLYDATVGVRTIVGYIRVVTSNYRVSAVPPCVTLLNVCREIATAAEWAVYVAAERIGPEALRKQFPADFSECAPGASAIDYHDRPYDDPVAAQMFLKARSVEQALLERAVTKMVNEHWVAQVRRAGQTLPVSMDPTLLLSLKIPIDASTINLEGVEYLDLAFRPASADRFEELVQLVRHHDSRMDPRVDTIADFQRAVSANLPKPISREILRRAMMEAGVMSKWSAKGRKAGSPSHRK